MTAPEVRRLREQGQQRRLRTAGLEVLRELAYVDPTYWVPMPHLQRAAIDRVNARLSDAGYVNRVWCDAAPMCRWLVTKGYASFAYGGPGVIGEQFLRANLEPIERWFAREEKRRTEYLKRVVAKYGTEATR